MSERSYHGATSRSCRIAVSVHLVFLSSVVREFAHGAMGRRIDPSWGEPIELCHVPASVPRLV